MKLVSDYLKAEESKDGSSSLSRKAGRRKALDFKLIIGIVSADLVL
jgi:hypothetical protein